MNYAMLSVACRCGDVVSKFLELDIEDGNVVAFLKDYVISIADGVI